MKSNINWAEHIAKWEVSGMSKQAFCAQESLSYQSFLYHHKRSLQRDVQGSFHQLSVSATRGDDKIDYFFQDGRRVSFPLSTAKEMIRFVLSL
jgi:hypothetical protein